MNKMSEDETFKASHFENIQELLDTCKMWIRDDDYDAYCRFFDMGAMEELLNELEKKDKIIELMIKHLCNVIDNDSDASLLPFYDSDDNLEEKVKKYFERKAEDE